MLADTDLHIVYVLWLPYFRESLKHVIDFHLLLVNFNDVTYNFKMNSFLKVKNSLLFGSF